MNTSRTLVLTAAAGVVALAANLTGAGNASGHPAVSAALSRPAVTSVAASKHSLLHPAHKYYGVFADGAPADMTPITEIKQQTGKEPNLALWYQAWGSTAKAGTVNFDAAAARQACAAGILPMLTWESWDTSVTAPNEGAAYAQRPFAAKKIIAGDYDAFIRNTAKSMAGLGCPIALRFDQEQNGYWYPWGIHTKGMGSLKDTPALYAAMWRHVWTIFHNEHANNVLWVWSPNYQGLPHKGLPSLHASYPGSKYVDWVGMDGYYNKPGQTFVKLFGSTMAQLKFAKNKPWLVSETAVGTDPDKPKQITNLLSNVATRKQFNGFVYFDYYASGKRSNWRFQETPASLKAFKTGVSKSVFGAAKPGSL